MYFGSVKFFKHMILLTMILFIAIPTVSALRLRASLSARETELARTNAALADAERKLKKQDRELAELSSQIKNEEDDPADPEPPAEPAAPASFDTPYYQDLYPDFYAPEAYHATLRVPGTIFLAFDDGPSGNTTRILDILAAQDVKATFFVVGQSSEAGCDLLREIAAQGHTLAMHSYTHDYNKIYASVESFLEDMYQNFIQIREATGVTPTFFRFPGGSINAYNAGMYQELISEMIRRGFVPCDWNMSARDASKEFLTAAQVVSNVLQNADEVECGYVLLHDSGARGTTVDALDTIIEELRSRGFAFSGMTPEIRPVLFGYTD